MQQCQIQIMFPNSEFEICSQISALLWPPPPPSEVRGQKSAEMQMRVQGFQKKYEKSAENISEYENSAENIALQSTLYERSKHEIKMKKTSRTNVF